MSSSGPAEDVFVGLKNFARLGRDDKFLDGWLLLFQYSAMCLTLRDRASACCSR